MPLCLQSRSASHTASDAFNFTRSHTHRVHANTARRWVRMSLRILHYIARSNIVLQNTADEPNERGKWTERERQAKQSRRVVACAHRCALRAVSAAINRQLRPTSTMGAQPCESERQTWAENSRAEYSREKAERERERESSAVTH